MSRPIQEAAIVARPPENVGAAFHSGRLRFARMHAVEIAVLPAFWVFYVLGFAYTRNPRGLNLESVFYPTYYLAMGLFIAYVVWPRYAASRAWAGFALAAGGVFLANGFIEDYVIHPFLFHKGVAGFESIRKFLDYVWYASAISAPVVLLRVALDLRDSGIRLAELEAVRLRTELLYLKSQIQPHVLFNALNNVFAYASEGSACAPEMISKLANVLRYVLYEAEKESVLLDQEIALLQDYVELHRIPMEGVGRVSFVVEGSTQGLQIAPCLLFSVLENTFKHGLQRRKAEVHIDIRLHVRDACLDLTAENAFEPAGKFSAVRPPNAKGVGLVNLRRQLSLLYGERHILEQHQDANFFKVRLRIALRRSSP